MPSQEDYLDSLLKDMSKDVHETAAEQDAPADQDVPAPDLDAVADMSEEDIEKLLSAGTEQKNDELSSVSDMDLPDEDVLKMLEESDDEDLQGIQDLLQKSDNNEAVDDSIAELLKDYPEEDLAAGILGDSDEAVSREEKKNKAREKKEQKRAEAAAKKAEKKAAKEAAKEAKAAAKKKKQNGGKKSKNSGTSLEEKPEQDTFDASILDSIVSEADQAGKKTADGEQGDISGAVTETNDVKKASAVADMEDDLNLDDLFGDGDTDAALGMDSDPISDIVSEGVDAALAKANAEEDKDAKNAEPKRKQSFLARFLNFLTEEEEEEENENIKLSQENQDILNDLENEDKAGKGKKGKKDKKDAKKAKEKPKKEPKPKKPSKPKKEKPVKETTPEPPGKKLSFKKMLPVFLVGISVGVLLFVFVNSSADYSDKRTARAAYYEGDYQTCYQNLFGKDLNETESVMFGKSESILYIRLWVREYEMFMGEGDRVRALDSLIQSVDRYPELYHYAGQWNAESEVAAGYATILNYLSGDFGLTEGEAQIIAAVRSDREYTKMVTAIANGKTFENWNEPTRAETPDNGQVSSESTEEQLPDALPEEEELGDEVFINNQ